MSFMVFGLIGADKIFHTLRNSSF
uniref:Uncharacterized protein n=1 Tax=Anguilla anguilla TaxID=7936 RepID=A0A0E9VJY5_ANGAN